LGATGKSVRAGFMPLERSSGRFKVEKRAKLPAEARSGAFAGKFSEKPG